MDLNEKKDPKKWWVYLITCVVEDIKTNRKKWNWNYIKSHSQNRKSYVENWFLKKSKQKYDEKLLKQLEKDLEIDVIIYFRKLAKELMSRQIELSQENQKSFSIFGKKFTNSPVKLIFFPIVLNYLLKKTEH